MGSCSHRGKGANKGESEAGSRGRHRESASGQPLRGECVHSSFTLRITRDFQQPLGSWPPFKVGREIFNYFVGKEVSLKSRTQDLWVPSPAFTSLLMP